MKKIGVLLAISLLASCQSFNFDAIKKKPEVKITRYDIDSISFKEIRFLFDISIKNPYPIGLKLNKVAFDFKINGNKLFSTNTNSGMSIKASGTETTTTIVTLKYEDIIRIVKDYSNQDYLHCEIATQIVIPLPSILQSIKKDVTVNYVLKKDIPAIKPTVEIANFSIKKPSLFEIEKNLKSAGESASKSRQIFDMFKTVIDGKKYSGGLNPQDLDIPLEISFDVILKNKTKARLDFRGLAYDFYLNSEKLLTGETKNILNERNGSTIKISSRISSRALGKSVLNLLQNKEGSYELKGASFIKLPDAIKIEPVKLEINEKGRFSVK